MKTNPTQVTKSDLLDYVTRLDFNDFRKEVLDRFDSVSDKFASVDVRFNAVDKRFDSLERRIDSLDRKVESIREDFRIHTGVILQQSREEFKIAMEYMQYVEAKKLDKEEFEALERRIQHLIG